jgi:hypothetical protein
MTSSSGEGWAGPVVSRAAVIVVTGALAVLAGCAHQFTYVPVGPGTAGGAAAQVPIPPEAPQGEVYVTSFGFTDLDVGPNQPGRMLHARLAVSNGSAIPWAVDGRQQMLVAAGQPAQPPAFLNTDAGEGPVYQVSPGRANVFDLYYAMPAPLDQPGYLGAFALDWNVDVGGRVIAQQTEFQRFDGPAPSYAAYPPYVVIGLGFGVGWWYGPFYPHRYRYPPVIRGYYYAPGRARGGAWRGAPPGAWRGAPPRAGWRGTPPAASSPGGWRGTPPGAPAPARSAPLRSAPPARGGGWRGGGGRRR